MLQAGNAVLYSDNRKTHEPERKNIKISGKTVTVSMPNQGGFVLVQ